MQQLEASYTSSIMKHIFPTTNSRDGPGFDRRPYAPFQTIIEKGKQAKAQDEHDQYEARKSKREMDIKNAARIRHAEAEANRRRAEESKLSTDDYKGKLLDEMTKNIKAVLENQYREEIREKVYEDEDKIISAYEHDLKDQTKARLVRELESVVKAKLGAEFETDVKQQLAVELLSVVKAELRAEYEIEVKQQLARELGPEVEAELRVKYGTEVKQQLAEELKSVVKAELRAKYEEEIKHRLAVDPGLNIVHTLKSTETNDVENESQAQREALHSLDEATFTATPNNINEEDKYSFLSHHQHCTNQNGFRNDQQKAESVQSPSSSDTNGKTVDVPHGTKRSLRNVDDREEDLDSRHSKRSRSVSSNRKEQQLPSDYEEGVSNLDSSYFHLQKPYQSVRYNGEEYQDYLEYKVDAGFEDAQGNIEYKSGGGASGYNSSDEIPGGHKNMLDGGGADYDAAEDIQEVDGNLLHHEEADYDSDQDVQGMDGEFLDHEGADYGSAEDTQGMRRDSFSGEEADYDSAEDIEGSRGYNLDGEATESYSSKDGDEEGDDDEEEYDSEQEEQYSTAPQAVPHSDAGIGVITVSNTQDTAFILSDSEDDGEENADDEDKTLIGYEGPSILNDAKRYAMPGEESLFLDARSA